MKNPQLRLLCAVALSGILAAIWLLTDYFVAIPLESRADFVGSATCAKCHEAQFHSWQGSPHDRAMDLANTETVLGDFNNVSFSYQGVSSRMFRDGDRYMIHTEGPDGTLDNFEVKYVFGFDPLQQYMVELPDGRVQVLRISWDSKAHKWFYHYPPDVPDEKLAPDDPLHWTGRMSNWQQMCAECHSTNLQKNFDIETACYQTRFSEIDVSCETCHGPGSLHVRLAEAHSLFWDRHHGYGLPNLKDKNSKFEIESCAPCHSRRHRVFPDFRPGGDFLDYYEPALLREGLYHADGQILDEVYVYGSFLQSKMHAKGVRCTDCHDPHTTKLKHEGNRLCTSCHQHPAGKYDVPAHHHHQPGSPGAQCVECHMPATHYMLVDPRRDHSIRNPRPDLSVELGTPNACTGCHLEMEIRDRGDSQKWPHYADALAAAARGDATAEEEIARVNHQMLAATEKWYANTERKTSEKLPHYAHALDAARKGKPQAEELLTVVVNNKETPPIVKATAIEHLANINSLSSRALVVEAMGDENPLVRGVSIRNLAQQSPNAEDLITAVAPLLDDPVRMVRTSAAQVLAPLSRELPPEDRRAFERATEELRAGQQADPDLASSHYNLGNFSLDLGQEPRAAGQYQQALQIDPLFFPARFNLGMLYSRTRQDKLAEAEFRRLTQQDPTASLPWYRLGLILGRRGRFAEAEVALQRALKLEPNNFDYLYGLGIFFLETGQLEKSLDQARSLQALMPGLPATRQLIQKIQQEMRSAESPSKEN